MKELRLRRTGPLRPAVEEFQASDQQQIHNFEEIVCTGVDHQGSPGSTVSQEFGVLHVDVPPVGHVNAERLKGASSMQLCDSFDGHDTNVIQSRPSVNVARFGTDY